MIINDEDSVILAEWLSGIRRDRLTRSQILSVSKALYTMNLDYDEFLSFYIPRENNRDFLSGGSLPIILISNIDNHIIFHSNRERILYILLMKIYRITLLPDESVPEIEKILFSHSYEDVMSCISEIEGYKVIIDNLDEIRNYKNINKSIFLQQYNQSPNLMFVLLNMSMFKMITDLKRQ